MISGELDCWINLLSDFKKIRVTVMILTLLLGFALYEVFKSHLHNPFSFREERNEANPGSGVLFEILWCLSGGLGG